MNVGIISYRCGGPGGIESIAASLGAALIGLSQRVRFICSDPVAIPPGAEVIRVRSIRHSGTLRHCSFRLTSALAVRNIDCDILHSFGMTARFDIFAAQSCHKAGLRILRRYNASLIENPFGLGLANKVALIQEKRNFSVSSGQRIIACSHRTKAEIVEEYGSDEKRIIVIPNGVDPDRFFPAQEKKEKGRRAYRMIGVPATEPVLLFIGNEFARKGLAALIRSLPMFKGSAPHLVVTGAGNQVPYRRLARRCGVEARIFFTGLRTDVEDLLAASDIFILPTLHEAFGLVILEAMASGVPVVASACAGAVEDVGRDGENCLALRSPGQPEEIAAAVQKLLDDSDLRNRLGREGAATASEYSWSEIGRQTIDVYKEVLDVKGK